MPGDPLWMQSLLAIHIAAGTLCLVLAPFVLAVTKGGPRHKRWGRYYLWSMGAVAATAAPMALYRPVLILALLAVLSFYLAFSGYRILRLKALARGGSAGAIDWLAAILTFAVCAALAADGLVHLSWQQPMNIVAAGFGLLGMRGTAMDMRRFLRRREEPMFWLPLHIARFLGSYIAAWTAFSAVTLSQFIPATGVALPYAGVVVWTWPSVAGICAIAVAIAYYKRKFAAAAP